MVDIYVVSAVSDETQLFIRHKVLSLVYFKTFICLHFIQRREILNGKSFPYNTNIHEYRKWENNCHLYKGKHLFRPTPQRDYLSDSK